VGTGLDTHLAFAGGGVDSVEVRNNATNPNGPDRGALAVRRRQIEV
jgi:hypothetical protein